MRGDISLLIIPCLIYYVTNKETLTLRGEEKIKGEKKVEECRDMTTYEEENKPI